MTPGIDATKEDQKPRRTTCIGVCTHLLILLAGLLVSAKNECYLLIQTLAEEIVFHESFHPIKICDPAWPEALRGIEYLFAYYDIACRHVPSDILPCCESLGLRFHRAVANRFGIEFLFRLRERRDQTAPLRGWFSRWRWADGAFHAKSHVKQCPWTHGRPYGQYRHEGTAEAQGNGTEVANAFWKQYHNILTPLSPSLYDATVELIGDWWNEMRTWEIVKILKRNVDTQSKSSEANLHCHA